MRVSGSETPHLSAGTRGRGWQWPALGLSRQPPQHSEPLGPASAGPGGPAQRQLLLLPFKEKREGESRSTLLREASWQGQRRGEASPSSPPRPPRVCRGRARPPGARPPARCPEPLPSGRAMNAGTKVIATQPHQPPHQPLRCLQRPELPGGSSFLGGEAGRGRVAGAESRGLGESRRLKSRAAAGASSH